MELNRFDLEAAVKRAKSLTKTAEGREALGEVFGLRFVNAEEGKSELPIVACLVPTHYAPKPQMTQAFGRLMEESKGHAVVLPQPSIGSSVVHWVRNQLLSKLYKSGQPFTHVLFIDDDIVPPADGLVKMLAHGKDIIGAACTVRQDPPKPNFRVWDESEMQFKTAFEWNGEGLMQVGGVGTGMMLISRTALDAIAEYYFTAEYEQRYLGIAPDKAARFEAKRRERFEKTGDAWWFQFLKHPNGDEEYGEDLSFCFKARECGIGIYVDTTVRPAHVGDYGYGMWDFEAYRSDFLRQEAESKQIVVTD